ncbi:MAG TPA: FHA domain-containing protein [Nitrospiraceae bacterium]|jgi:pSer/pThr/pTyr-binding forkhead associated (FHA) protein
MAKLLLKFSGMVLKDIPLNKPLLTIGRKMDNDVVIDNLAVSGHHARVVEENGTYFIEDTGSTNGTFLNDAKIAKQRMQPGDQIRVGKHILVFEDESATGKPRPAPAVSQDGDKTVSAPPSAGERKVKPADESKDALPGGKIGVLLVVAGQTDKNEYKLTGRVSVIGSQNSAVVKLTGWFAPKVAALISRSETAYVISLSEESKKILVNGEPVQGRGDLKDGDLIEVAGVKMYFYLRHPTS